MSERDVIRHCLARLESFMAPKHRWCSWTICRARIPGRSARPDLSLMHATTVSAQSRASQENLHGRRQEPLLRQYIQDNFIMGSNGRAVRRR
jgi:hypothetical protein